MKKEPTTQVETKPPSKKPYLVDTMPEIRWIATCAICGVSRVVPHDAIADGTWIECPTCTRSQIDDVEEAEAA